MQYSTTSNAALLHIVRSHPTIVGQYRQAVLEQDQRLQNLKAVQFLFRKQEQELKLKELKQQQLKVQIESAIDPDTKLELECKAAILAIEVEEAIFNLEQTAKLIPDAERELRFCNVLIGKLCDEFKTIAPDHDLRELDESQFQMLMAEEFRAKQIRHWSSHFIANRIGMSPDFVQTMLEVSDADREYLLKANQLVMSGFLGDALQPQPDVPQMEAEADAE